MNFYSQKNQDWAYHKLGTCNTTIKNNGCFVTCYAMLDGRTPAEVNKLFRNNGGYAKGCMVIQAKCSYILELEDDGRTYGKPNYICIAETDHYNRQGVPQHFYILHPNGKIVDPLDKNPTWKKNPYNIVSCRLIKLKKPMQDEPNENEVKLLKFMKKLFKWGDYLNSKERKNTEKDIVGCKKEVKELKEQIEELKKNSNERLIQKADKCDSEIVILSNKLKDRNNECTELANKSAEVTSDLQTITQERNELLEETEKLQSLQDSEYKALGLISRLQEALKLIMAFKK